MSFFQSGGEQEEGSQLHFLAKSKLWLAYCFTLVPSCFLFQQLRPLDLESAEILSNVRAKFLQVQQSLEGVSSQLDSRLEAIYEERRQKGR